LTTKTPLTDPVLRDELRLETKADIVDMEALYLFISANNLKLPFVSLKVVSDNADNDAILNIKQYGKQWSKVLGKVAFDFINYYLDCRASINIGSSSC
ncbi:MAG: hypothetical protein E3J54_05480, partial [Actinobacteria bacterium]